MKKLCITSLSVVLIGATIFHLDANVNGTQQNSSCQTISNDSSEWLLLKAILNNNTKEMRQIVKKVVTEKQNEKASALGSILLEKPNTAQDHLESGIYQKQQKSNRYSLFGPVRFVVKILLNTGSRIKFSIWG